MKRNKIGAYDARNCDYLHFHLCQSVSWFVVRLSVRQSVCLATDLFYCQSINVVLQLLSVGKNIVLFSLFMCVRPQVVPNSERCSLPNTGDGSKDHRPTICVVGAYSL